MLLICREFSYPLFLTTPAKKYLTFFLAENVTIKSLEDHLLSILNMNYAVTALIEFHITDCAIVVFVSMKLIMKRSPIAKVAPTKISRMSENHPIF